MKFNKLFLTLFICVISSISQAAEFEAESKKDKTIFEQCDADIFEVCGKLVTSNEDADQLLIKVETLTEETNFYRPTNLQVIPNLNKDSIYKFQLQPVNWASAVIRTMAVQIITCEELPISTCEAPPTEAEAWSCTIQ